MQRLFHFSSARYWLIAGPPHNFVVIEVKCVSDDESNQIFSFLKKEKKYCDTSVSKMCLQRKMLLFSAVVVCVKDETADISTNA